MCTYETITVVVCSVHHFLCTCKLIPKNIYFSMKILSSLVPGQWHPFLAVSILKVWFHFPFKATNTLQPTPSFSLFVGTRLINAEHVPWVHIWPFFTISNLLTTSKWQYYRIFAESLEHWLLTNMPRVWPSIWHGNQNLTKRRQQNTGIRAVHSNVWEIWL